MSAAAPEESLVARRSTTLDHAASEVDLGDVPPTSAAWLAAYAMGLVASDREDEGAAELLGFARQGTEPIRAAVRHLADPSQGDARLRIRARELLAAAVDDAQVSSFSCDER